VVHSGPVPYFVHQTVDYAFGVLLIAAPWIFAFSDLGSATATAIVLGLIVLVMGASTDGPLSLVDAIPIPVHIVGDVALSVVLIASPFLFGFSDEGGALAFFLVMGVVGLLVVIATRFPHETRTRRAG
jgi:hypothetical protein